MYLIKTSNHGKSFNELLTLAVNGDRIFINDFDERSDIDRDWKPSQNGVVSRIGNRFFDLAHDTLLYEGPCKEWHPLGDGIAFSDEGGKIFYSASEDEQKMLLTEHGLPDWKAGRNGIFMNASIGIHYISLKGEDRMMCEEILQEHEWHPAHDDGIVVELKEGLVHISLDGKRTILANSAEENYYHEQWVPHPQGVVTYAKNTGLFLSTGKSEEVELGGSSDDDAVVDNLLHYAPGLPGVIINLWGMVYLIVHKD